jgi:hypothetical protein
MMPQTTLLKKSLKESWKESLKESLEKYSRRIGNLEQLLKAAETERDIYRAAQQPSGDSLGLMLRDESFIPPPQINK